MVWRKLTKERLEDTKAQFAANGKVMQWYAMASEVLLTTLGPEWWKKNRSSSPKRDRFLQASESEDSDWNHQVRVIQLGDMLFLLKDCEGFDAFISSLKTRDLESVFFELYTAKMLHGNGFVIEFIEESGEKQKDYDLFAKRGEDPICVEAKSRRSGAVLTAGKLKSTLETARKQLPAAGPGIVFVQIPHEWPATPDSERIIGGCIGSFLRNSGRVNSVIVVWQRWFPIGTGRGSAWIVRQFDNQNPRTSASLGQIIKPLEFPPDLSFENQLYSPSFW